MQNDKVFIAYALTLLIGISSVAAYAISSGPNGFPTPVFLIEHVALGLLLRGYYKSFDGSGGYYAVANGLRSYFGLEELAVPASAVAVMR